MKPKIMVSLMLALVLTVGLSAAAQAVSIVSVSLRAPGAGDTLAIAGEITLRVNLASTLVDTAAAMNSLQVWVAASYGGAEATPDTVIAKAGYLTVKDLTTNFCSTTDFYTKLEKKSGGYAYDFTFTLSAMTAKWPPLSHQLFNIKGFACGSNAVVNSSAIVKFDPVRPTVIQADPHHYPVASVDYRIVSYTSVPTPGDTLLNLGDKIEVRADIRGVAEDREAGAPFYYGDLKETSIWVATDDMLGKGVEVATAKKDVPATEVTVDNTWGVFETMTKVYVYGFVRDRAGNLSSTTAYSQNPIGLQAGPTYFWVEGKAPTLKDTTYVRYRGSTFGAFDGIRASDGTQPYAGYPGVVVSGPGNVDNRLKIHLNEPGNIKVTMGSTSSVWTDTLIAAGIFTIDPFSETSGDSLTDGTYTVTVQGWDQAGNPAAPLSMTYTYDGTFPQFKDLYPASGDTVGTSHVYLTLSEALDSLRVGFVYPGSYPGIFDSTKAFTSPSVLNNLSEQMLSTTANDSLPERTYDLVIYGKDKAGNVTLRRVGDIVVVKDYVAPMITQFNLTDTAPAPNDSVDVDTEITLTVKAWDACVGKVAPRYKQDGVKVIASDSVGVTFEGDGVTDNGDGTATLDRDHWAYGQRMVKVKSSVVYEGDPLTITVADSSVSPPITGTIDLYYFPREFAQYLVTADTVVTVNELFDVIVTPTDVHGHPSLKQAGGIYTAPYSEVWIAFTANKTDVVLPGPQLITPLSTAVPQKTTSIGPDTFQVMATAAMTNLIVTVRTSPDPVQWGSTSPITVLEAPMAPEVPLAVGWNLVAAYALHENRPVEPCMRSIEGKYEFIWGWDATHQEWEWYKPGFELNTLDSLRVRMGYWIKATEGCWWAPSDTTGGVGKRAVTHGVSDQVPPLPFVLCGEIEGTLPEGCEMSLRDAAGKVLARYRMGSILEYGDRYVLRVSDPASEGYVYVGDRRVWNAPIAMEVGSVRWSPLRVRAIPDRYALYPNRPNPFNPFTAIAYDLPKVSDVTLTIYNVTGQQVATLVSRHQEAGRYQVVWDGSGFGNGIYFYRIEAGTFVETKRMVLIK